MNGDGSADWELFLNNIWTLRNDWCGKADLYSDGLRTGPIRGVADSIDGDSSIEIRVAKRFLEQDLNRESLYVCLVQYDRNWRLLDETEWFTLWGESHALASSVFEVLDCGRLTTDVEAATQDGNSLIGEYEGDLSYTAYLRTDPEVLPLAPQGQYQVCFDYRILETNPEGFEVLFFSPTGAGESNWVPSLRLHGTDGKSGRGCLEAQLHNYSDYEIRWNIISNGKIVIDNVVVRDLSTDQIVAEEDFEEWR